MSGNSKSVEASRAVINTAQVIVILFASWTLGSMFHDDLFHSDKPALSQEQAESVQNLAENAELTLHTLRDGFR